MYVPAEFAIASPAPVFTELETVFDNAEISVNSDTAPLKTQVIVVSVEVDRRLRLE